MRWSTLNTPPTPVNVEHPSHPFHSDSLWKQLKLAFLPVSRRRTDTCCRGCLP